MKNKRRVLKTIFFLIIMLILILGSLIYFQSGLPKYIKRYMGEPRLFEITDECSYLVGNLIHQIRDSDECKIRCNNQCETEKLNFYKMNFVQKNNSCHVCQCYCK